MSGPFSDAKSFSSPSQLAFGLGNAVDPHLPICLSVASFHRRRDRERRKGEVSEGNEGESKQEMDNSVFGGYGQEGLADLSTTKASRGGLEADGLPERDTVVWMIE